jgi:hypothetical protein
MVEAIMMKFVGKTVHNCLISYSKNFNVKWPEGFDIKRYEISGFGHKGGTLQRQVTIFKSMNAQFARVLSFLKL